jgi:hypothetical protein
LLRANRTRHIGLHLSRNSVHFAAEVAWATSLTLLGLATVFALEFTMPAWTPLRCCCAPHPEPDWRGSLGFFGVLVISGRLPHARGRPWLCHQAHCHQTPDRDRL